jgi:signal transduction histidine kinase
VEVAQPLQFDGRPIGRLVLETRLEELERQVRDYGLSAGLLAMLTLGAALAVALRLQRRISGPILRLAAKTREISERPDPEQRITEPASFEEIDTLVRGLNAMLAAIEEREVALASQAEALDRSNARLRALTTELSLVEERERKRLASELHDSAMQKLAVAQMQIASAVDDPEPDTPAPSDERLRVGLSLIRETLRELRSLQFELSPPALYLGGLPRALESLAAHTTARFGIVMDFVQSGRLPELDLDLAVVLYQCARELVYNLIKHAKADCGTIGLRHRGDVLELRVEDDGRGFAPGAERRAADATGGYGLYSIRERLALLGGSLDLESSARGARVTVRLPLRAESPSAQGTERERPANSTSE